MDSTLFHLTDVPCQFVFRSKYHLYRRYINGLFCASSSKTQYEDRELTNNEEGIEETVKMYNVMRTSAIQQCAFAHCYGGILCTGLNFLVVLSSNGLGLLQRLNSAWPHDCRICPKGSGRGTWVGVLGKLQIFRGPLESELRDVACKVPWWCRWACHIPAESAGIWGPPKGKIWKSCIGGKGYY